MKILLMLACATVSLSAQAPFDSPIGRASRAADGLAQGRPDFSGTWTLDAEKSKVTATAGIIGLISAGAPKTLHITQPANGTLVIESQINEAHVRIYKPGAQTSTPAGQGGIVTMTTKWDGRSLVSEGAMKAPNGDTTTVKEVVALSADGKALTIEINTTAAASTLVYTRITSVGGCETWPTPCKRSPG
jgi:hypothetical protein